MAWRWFKKLMERTTPRSRKKGERKRRLFVEELEQRRLLAGGVIIVDGTISVLDLVASTRDVPVRGIHVHAWLGDNKDYNPNPTKDRSAGLNRRLILEELKQRRSARKNFSGNRILGSRFATITRMDLASVLRLAGIKAMAQAA
jgi:hypothetical protein